MGPPAPVSGVGLAFGALTARIDVFVAHDVVLTEIGAGLYFDQDHGHFVRVFHPVLCSEWDIDRLVFSDEFDFVIHSHFCCSGHNDPVFRTMVVALQAQGCSWVYVDALHLKAV